MSHVPQEEEPGQAGPSRPHRTSKDDDPPDWETIRLPPAHVLFHLTDAHCHPTDLNYSQEVYDDVSLGGLAAMATVPEDQGKIKVLYRHRPWSAPSTSSTAIIDDYPDTSSAPKDTGDSKGPRVVACFGYHPWFAHRYTVKTPTPSKLDHYTSIFFPEPSGTSATSSPNPKVKLLRTLLPYLPDPIPFEPLLEAVKTDIQSSLAEGRLTMLGEVGLDGGARMRWPEGAKRLHPDYSKRGSRSTQDVKTTDVKAAGDSGSDDTGEHANTNAIPTDPDAEDKWIPLTPFKTSMKHQRALVEAQMEIAIELGVNVSFHSVAAPGPTMEVLILMRDKHKSKFTNRINVDIHSGGGWSPEFWRQAERNFLNLYASPSIFITGRSSHAAELIRAISPDRVLVESDSHDVTLSTRLVWAATEWIASCKTWKLEGVSSLDGHDVGEEEWGFDLNKQEDEDAVDEKGNLVTEQEIWTVRTLERNWARFMRLIED